MRATGGKLLRQPGQALLELALMTQRGAFALLKDSMHVAYARPYILQEVGRVLFAARRPAGAGFEIEEGSWEKLGQQGNMA